MDLLPPAFALSLVTIGVLLLVGMVASLVAERVPIPRVTLLILAGIAVGTSGLDLLPDLAETWHPIASTLALMFVGFLLGSRLRLSVLRAHGREILAVTTGKVMMSVLMVGLGLWLIGVDPVIVLLLAGISTATAPATVQAVARELNAAGPFPDTMLAVIALDDALGLIIFALLLTAADFVAGSGHVMTAFLHGLWDVGGAIAIGVVLGVPGSLLMRHIRGSDPLEAEAIGLVMLCGGIALALQVSYLIAAIALGTIVANMARDNDEPFETISKFEWPLLVLFFVLSGAAMNINDLATAGWITLAYAVLRVGGTVFGSWAGAAVSGMPPIQRGWIGPSLLPQAGIAIAAALIGAQAFPDRGGQLLSIVVATTIVFELLGPAITRLAIVRVGEARIRDRNTERNDG